MNVQVEKIKGTFRDNTETSKKIMKELIDANFKNIDSALDTNMVIVNSIKDKLSLRKMDDSVTGALNDTFSKSVELAADALDNITNAFSKQIELNADYNTKLADSVSKSHVKIPETILKVISENFEVTRQLIITNTKEMLVFYHKHTNIAFNFNNQCGENINAQIESLFKIKTNGLDTLTGWASKWWKETCHK